MSLSNIPALNDFSRRVNEAFRESQNIRESILRQLENINEYRNFMNKWHVKLSVSPSTIKEMYLEMINNLRIIACRENKYWKFDMEFISPEEALIYCTENFNLVVSEHWRVIGEMNDIISLAKLAGYCYQPNGREYLLPGFDPESSYWIKNLKLMRICEGETVSPCNETIADTCVSNKSCKCCGTPQQRRVERLSS